MSTSLRRMMWIVGVAVLALMIARAFRSQPVLVDVAPVRRGTLRVTADDDGFTRVKQRYTISAPIQGRLLRPPLDPGDPVRAGETPVAEFVPIAPQLLDPRSREEAQARLLRAEAALNEAQARRDQAAAEQEYAEAELKRTQQLAKQKIQPQGVLDEAVRNDQQAREGLRAAVFAVQIARSELDFARASLREAEPTDLGDASAVDGRRLLLTSPVTGRVLRVFEESSRTLNAGAPILEVGDTRDLEIVADYLSRDAVKVRPGMDVFIEGWGGQLPNGEDEVLRGRVRVVEPAGFTKISALGVEEQRVNIIVDPVGDSEDWALFGDGYRVDLRILLAQKDDVTIVPTGALFRQEDAWTVFVVEDGKARRRRIEVGRKNGLEAEVLEGLREGDEVVLYPSDLVYDGAAVEPRA